MPLEVRDLNVYVPAKDFEQSKRFYSALGFELTEGWGGVADFELGEHRFRLQDDYVKDWADNFIVVMSVDDVEVWHHHVKTLVDSGEFDSVHLKPPETVDYLLTLHVIDPSGVLLVFVQ